MQLQQLSRAEHGALRIDPRKAMSEAANVHLIPLTAMELRRAASCFPVFFVKNLDTGRFYPAALVGLLSGDNLFWNGDGFEADHIPFNIQRLPFYVGSEDAGTGMICIDADSPGLDPAGPCRILNEDGSDSDYIRSIQAILSELSAQQVRTRELVDEALALGIVTEIKLDVVLHNGEGIGVEGLYGIDETALERQFDLVATFERKLQFAAMLDSQNHVAGLVRRLNERNAELEVWHGALSGTD